MRNVLTTAGLALALVAMAVAVGQPKTASADPPAPAAAAAAPSPAQEHQQDEKAIRLAAEAFAKAYNAGDARAIGSLFAADGEIVNEAGEATQGRAAIEQVFAAIFKEHPHSHIDVVVQSVRFVAPTVAIEDGTSAVVHEPNEPPERSPYNVVHVQRDGRWQMASARDLHNDEPTAEEQLKQLEWIIGDWVDESPDALITTSYRWTDNHCYILADFTVHISGRPAMTGSQRIGWDPLAKKIRSWVFDSEAGFGEGLWTRQGNQWIVKMTGVTPDGQAGSSTNITTRISKDRMTWQSRDRVVGDETMPDVNEIPIVRKPPQPK